MSIGPEQIATVEKPMWYIATGIWVMAMCLVILTALNYGLINPSSGKENETVNINSPYWPIGPVDVRVTELP